jgi:murein DD-endopeptidase MepM/ murein hydrolase activator NlpD
MVLLGGGVLGAMLLRDRVPPVVPRGRVVAPPSGTWVWPVPSYRGRRPVISDGWGSPRDGGSRAHRGADIMYRRAHREELVDVFAPGTPDGTKWHFMPLDMVAVAAADGRVWSAGWTPRGNAVVIDHGKPWATFYAHLASLRLVEGQRVRVGEVIGVIGADPLDGRKVRHLHFAMWHGGGGRSAVDPAPLMRKWSVVEVADV